MKKVTGMKVGSKSQERCEKPPQTVKEADRIQEEERERLEKIIRRQLERGKGKDDKENKPQATPWLLMRYSIADLGARPIPSGEAHWRSPDIWIESSDTNGNGVAGEENFVHAQIFNLGMVPAVPVQVDFYWADPSVGLGPSAMNLIGTEWVTLNSISSVDVRCNTPWIPSFVNNGHECLMVNCNNHILDPILSPFQPRIDRHVGQRNVTVLQGEATDTVEIGLIASNIFGLDVDLEFVATVQRFKVDPVWIRKTPFRIVVDEALSLRSRSLEGAASIAARYRPGTAAHHTAQKIARMAGRRQGLVDEPTTFFPITGGTALRLKAELSESLGITAPSLGEGQVLLARELLARDTLTQGMDCVPSGGVPLISKVPFKGHEMRRLNVRLTLPADAKDGEFFVVDVMQKAYGMIAGGYSIVVRFGPQQKE